MKMKMKMNNIKIIKNSLLVYNNILFIINLFKKKYFLFFVLGS